MDKRHLVRSELQGHRQVLVTGNQVSPQTKMDSTKSEQKVIIKFLLAEGNTGTNILQRLQAVYGDKALSKSRVFELVKQFKEGNRSETAGPSPGRPRISTTPENIAYVEHLVMQDRRMTIDEIAELTCISHGSVHSILTEHLRMRKVSARWVPKM